MSKQIYIVVSSCGEYEDFRTYNEKAFINKDDAELYAKILDDQHNSIPDFITEEFEQAYDEVFENLPDWGACPVRFDEDKNSYFKWMDDNNAKDIEIMIAELAKRGFNVDANMLKLYEDWQTDSYTDWHPCHIETIDLE